MGRLALPFKILIMLLVPVALVGFGLRLLLSPLFLQLEYRLPGFPADEYGFSMADRLHWGTYGITYLVNGAPITYLGNLDFANGEPVFSQRELSHMEDVKRVVSGVLSGWYIAMGVLVALALWAWAAGWSRNYCTGLRLGGWLTLGIAALAGAVGTLGAAGSGEVFWQFFSGFHELFFTGDTWLFSYSDTLIRLYPLRFWQDAVLYIGILTAAGAASLSFGIKDQARKPKG